MDEELQGIVQKMVEANESEENIKLVIENYTPESKEVDSMGKPEGSQEPLEQSEDTTTESLSEEQSQQPKQSGFAWESGDEEKVELAKPQYDPQDKGEQIDQKWESTKKQVESIPLEEITAKKEESLSTFEDFKKLTEEYGNQVKPLQEQYDATVADLLKSGQLVKSEDGSLQATDQGALALLSGIEREIKMLGDPQVLSSQLKNSANQLEEDTYKEYVKKAEQGNIASLTYDEMLTGVGEAGSGVMGMFMPVIAAMLPEEARGGMSIMEASEQVRKDLSPYVREGLKETIGTGYTTDEYINEFNKSFLGKAYTGVVKSVPSMLTAKVPINLLGQGADQGFKMVEDKEDLSAEEKYAFSGVYGLVSAALEKVGIDAMFSNKSAVNGLVNRFIQESAEKGVKPTANAAIDFVARVSGEGLTEGVQQASDWGLRESVNAIKDKDVFEHKGIAEEVLAIGESTALGMVGGTMMMSPVAIGKNILSKESVEPEQKEAVWKAAEVARDPNYMSDLGKVLDAKVEAGEITEQQRDETLEGTAIVVEQINKIDPTIPIEKQKEVFQLVNERDRLVAETEGLEVINPKTQERIDNLNEQIQNFGKPKEEIDETKTKEQPKQQSTDVQESSPDSEQVLEGEERGDGDIQEEAVKTFYTGRGRKVDDFKQTRGEFIFFTKDKSIAEWYGGDEGNVTESDIDTDDFLDLSSQENKAKFISDNFTEKDIHKLFPSIRDRTLFEDDVKKKVKRITETLKTEERFSGDGKKQQYLLNKIKQLGYKGVILEDSFFGKTDNSYIVIDKDVISKPKEVQTEEKVNEEVDTKEPTKEQYQKALDILEPLGSEYAELTPNQMEEVYNALGENAENVVDLSKKKNAQQLYIELADKQKQLKDGKGQKELRSEGEEIKTKEVDKKEIVREEVKTQETSVKEKTSKSTEVKETKEQRVFGIKKALNTPDTESAKSQKRNFKTIKESGQKLVESGEMNVPILIEEIKKKPRPLTPEETAASIYYRANLSNKLEDSYRELDKANKSNDIKSIAEIESNIEQISKDLDDFKILSEKTGHEQGLGLAIRRLMLNEEYDIVNQINTFKAANKGYISKARESKIAQQVELIKNLNKEIADLRSQKTVTLDPRKTKENREARKKELQNKFFSTLNDASRIPTLLVDPEFYEYAGMVLEDALGDFKEFSKRMSKALGKEIEPELQEIYDRIATESLTESQIKDNSAKAAKEIRLMDELESLFNKKDSRSEQRKLEIREELNLDERIQRSITATQRSIDELKRRIKEKDFEPKYKIEVKDPKLDKLRGERDVLRKQYNELKKDSPLEKTKQQERKLKGLERSIGRIEEKLIKGDLAYQKKQVKQQEPQLIKEAREKLNSLREELDKKREESGLKEKKALEIRKTRVKGQIKKYKERLKNKDFIEEPKLPKEKDRELRDLEAKRLRVKEELDAEVEKAKLANRTLYEKSVNIGLEILNIPRTAMASVDLSAPLRQGAILGSSYPVEYAKAFKNMFKHAGSEEYFRDYMAKVKTSDMYALMKQSDLYLADNNAKLSAREEQFMSNFVRKFPFYGTKLVAGSERAYSGFLNELRVAVFNKLSTQLIESGYSPDTDIEAFQAAASFVNNATGRGELGVLEDAAVILNATMFSPRFAASRLNMINPMTYFNLRKKSPLVAKAYLRSMLSFVGAGMTVLTLLSLALEDEEDFEISTDIDSSDFGKVRIGDLRIDIWGGLQQWVRLIYKINTGVADVVAEQVTGKKKPKKFYEDDVIDVVGRFIRGKQAPMTSYVFDAMVGENIVGEEFVAHERAVKMLIPLFAQDMYEIYEKEGAASTAVVLPLAMFGAGVQYYPFKKKSKKKVKKRARI